MNEGFFLGGGGFERFGGLVGLWGCEFVMSW